MSKSKRISCSMPQSLVDDLDAIANHLNVSRSAVMTLLLEKSVGPLKVFAKQISMIDHTDPHSRKRAVDSTLTELSAQLKHLRSQVRELQ